MELVAIKVTLKTIYEFSETNCQNLKMIWHCVTIEVTFFKKSLIYLTCQKAWPPWGLAYHKSHGFP